MRGVALAALIGLIAALLTWTRPGDPTLSPAAPGQGAVLHILDNGFHTDIALPRAWLEARGGPLAEAVRALPPGQWVLVGWGDARFYVDQRPIHHRLPDGARAFLRPGNPSVVMLDPYRRDPAVAWGEDRRQSLTLSPRAFDALADRIEASLALENGRARIAAGRPGDDAVFLASHETFSVLRLCNHWSAEVLNAGGVSVRPARTFFSAEVMGAARRASELDIRASGD
ncbi:DUF2459 domain-containing protein [Brevundimonas sp. BAL450]|jgi:hypothetical protein|uniref:DUF2459 domain-containing protein n=1 Tax=Brevundimonas sp. BAL450 TaxID=1708162 RepID=UPI0018C96B92|nr:DUF2459 domain-containing protein [Brevundimonas sp. BAL450]MBG7615621.1 DUF2459 domain-containing protein [Brevundimonas sp. BAL450]